MPALGEVSTGCTQTGPQPGQGRLLSAVLNPAWLRAAVPFAPWAALGPLPLAHFIYREKPGGQGGTAEVGELQLQSEWDRGEEVGFNRGERLLPLPHSPSTGGKWSGEQAELSLTESILDLSHEEWGHASPYPWRD